MTASDHGVPPIEATDDADDLFLSPRHGGTEVYLIRHADALPDADEIVLGGDYDSQSLSALGRRQAQALGERAREIHLVALYSSPIARAHQTAAPIAQALGLEIQVDVELREVETPRIGPGIPPNATPDEAARALRRELHEIVRIALTSGGWSSIPGGEPSAVLRARALTAIDRIAANYPGQRVAIVSHGGVINAYVAAILGIERDYFFPCANTSISVVRVKGQRHLLLALNDVAHLRQAQLI